MPTHKLTYFGIPGRAEPIRIALTAAGVPFEDVRLTFEEWPKVKSLTPMGQLPMLEVDGVEMAQSVAILKYAGKLAKIYPLDDHVLALKVDEMELHATEMLPPAIGVVFGPAEGKKARAKEFVEKSMPSLLSKFEKLLVNRGQKDFCAGTSLTTADLHLWTVISFLEGSELHFETEDGPVDIKAKLSKYPTIMKINENVQNHEIVKNYYTAQAS